MMSSKDNHLLLGALLLIIAATVGYLFSAKGAISTEEQLQGLFSRQQELRQSLLTWLVEQNPEKIDATLARHIADSYFELGQYPWALVYYGRAKALTPRDRAVQGGWQSSLQKMGIESNSSSSHRLFMPFEGLLSLQEAIALLPLCSFLSLLSFFGYVWLRRRELQGATVLWAAMALFLAGDIFYSKYMMPAKAVVVAPAQLYPFPSLKAIALEQSLLVPGDLIDVIEISSDGRWLKVSTSDKRFGYAPYTALGLIN